MYHFDLLVAFRVIGDAEDKWDNDSVMKAAGFKRWLLKTNTCFLIMAYEEIFNKTDALFRVLQNKLMDIAFCCAQILCRLNVFGDCPPKSGTIFVQN